MNETSNNTAVDDALALVAIGPRASADPIEWLRLSGAMCKWCRGKEDVTEAAARILADSRQWYAGRCDELRKAQWTMRDPERTIVCNILANGSAG